MFLNDESQHETFRNLGISLEGATQGKTWFTGWKELPEDVAEGLGIPPGYVGQLIHYFGRSLSRKIGDHGVYVNLPGMQNGHILMGAIFDIGTERLKMDSLPTSEALEAMLRAGLEKLNALIEEWRDKE